MKDFGDYCISLAQLKEAIDKAIEVYGPDIKVQMTSSDNVPNSDPVSVVYMDYQGYFTLSSYHPDEYDLDDWDKELYINKED